MKRRSFILGVIACGAPAAVAARPEHQINQEALDFLETVCWSEIESFATHFRMWQKMTDDEDRRRVREVFLPTLKARVRTMKGVMPDAAWRIEEMYRYAEAEAMKVLHGTSG